MDHFKPARGNGLSDRRIVYELVADQAPDTKFSYEAIIDALSDGLDEPVDRGRVYRAVAQANKTLLQEKKRYLTVVRGEGYRVIRSEEHLPVALGRKNSAVQKLEQGVKLLRNARLEELSEAQRKLHEGQMLVMGGLYDAVSDSVRRHDKQEEVIEQIKSQQQADVEELARRLEVLEEKQAE